MNKTFGLLMKSPGVRVAFDSSLASELVLFTAACAGLFGTLAWSLFADLGKTITTAFNARDVLLTGGMMAVYCAWAASLTWRVFATATGLRVSRWVTTDPGTQKPLQAIAGEAPGQVDALDCPDCGWPRTLLGGQPHHCSMTQEGGDGVR